MQSKRNEYPGFGGNVAELCGYNCVDCGKQVISTIPTERCEPCHSANTLSYCWRHGLWYGDKQRPQCPECG